MESTLLKRHFNRLSVALSWLENLSNHPDEGEFIEEVRIKNTFKGYEVSVLYLPVQEELDV